MLKDWIIRKLGGFTEGDMKRVLNALDKVIKEKRYIERVYKYSSFFRGDSLCKIIITERKKPVKISDSKEGTDERIERT